MDAAALHAPVGATIELEGRVVADVAGNHRRVRCESIAVFEDGKLSQRSKKITLPSLSLVLDDGSRVKLDLTSLKEHSIAPRQRVHGLWKDARSELQILSQDQAIRPEQRVELRVGEIEDGANVCVRGVVAEHSIIGGPESAAFRGAATSRVESITVTQLAGGPEPRRAMAQLLEGAVDWAPSLLQQRSWVWMAFVAASAVPLLAYSMRPESAVWKADMVTTAVGLFAVAGAYLAERSQSIASQFALGAAPEGGRDVRFNNAIATLFAILMSTSVAWALVLDALMSHSRDTAFAAFSTVMTLVIALAMFVVTLRRARSFVTVARLLLAPAKATDRTSGAIEGVIGDRTPVESELGPAAVVALTVEEVVPGSDPNITSHSLDQKQDFFIRTSEGEVAVDIDKVRWASTVHMKLAASSKPHSSNNVFHHKAFIPVGAKALAWGRAPTRTGRGKVLSNAPDNEQYLFVTAPDEDPRAVLRALSRSLYIGIAMMAAALVAGAVFALAIWPYLPATATAD